LADHDRTLRDQRHITDENARLAETEVRRLEKAIAALGSALRKAEKEVVQQVSSLASVVRAFENITIMSCVMQWCMIVDSSKGSCNRC
jgi:hypothetical protein